MRKEPSPWLPPQDPPTLLSVYDVISYIKARREIKVTQNGEAHREDFPAALKLSVVGESGLTDGTSIPRERIVII